MRHGLLRIWKQAGLCASWYVPQGDSSVFNVTKRKFHVSHSFISPRAQHLIRDAQNVLQGVADPQVLLNDEDKKLFETWTRFNFETFWSDMNGPISADVIVIDDPQMTVRFSINLKRIN